MSVPPARLTRRTSEYCENLDKERKQLEIECNELLRQRDEANRMAVRIGGLLDKVLDGTATPEERAEFDRLLREAGPPTPAS